MADETNTTTGADGDASQTGMETITLNNRTITVPKAAVGILKDAESNLMSGYQAILAKEREKIDNDLAEDTKWYSTHPQPSWVSYDPKVHGGKGFTGDVSQLTTKRSEPVTTPETNDKPTVSFGEDMRVRQLERELGETKKAIEELQMSDIKRGAEQVKKDRDDLMRKYPYADPESVTHSLRNFWTDNQRHPQLNEIESIVKRNNDFVAVKVANAKQEMIPKQTATPSVSGTSPLSVKAKLPKLDDFEGWQKLAREDLVVI